MSAWHQTPHGIAAVIHGRRCEVLRRPGSGGGRSTTFRVAVEGVDESALRNRGFVKDWAEGKEVCWEALTAAGVVPQRAPTQPAGGASRYAPHPVELRARSLECALQVVGPLPGGIDTNAETTDAIGRRLALIKSIALNFEAFLLTAGQPPQSADAADGSVRAPS